MAQTHQWVIGLVLLLMIFYFAMFRYGLWEYWGILHIKPIFLDMYAILSASDAHRDGYNVFQENPYDVLERVHIYSRLWLMIGYSGLSRAANTAVGAVLVFLFLLTSVIILKPKTKYEFFVSGMVLFSPAVLLGVERGNNDLVIFILLAVAIYLLSCRRLLFDAVSCSLIFLAGALKFYPFIVFAVFVRHIKTNRNFYLFFICTALLWAGYFIATYSDFLILQKSVIRPYTRQAFGGALLFCWLFLQWPINNTVYFIAIFAVLLFSVLISPKFPVSGNTTVGFKDNLFLTGSACLFFCFFTITNYDYRCMFFIFTFPYLFETLRSKKNSSATNRLIRFFFILLPLVIWNELPLYYVKPLVNRLGWSHLESKIKYTIVLIEHFSTWIVITILLIFTVNLLKPFIIDKISSALVWMKEPE
ncbi:MAG: hypothetical protein ACOZF0_05680 [Thermodesulfobacteriota bacterium]